MSLAPSLRKGLLALHRWLGLGLGILFALAALSGSLLVFYGEIDRGLNPGLRVSSAGGTPFSLDQVLARLHRAEPQRAGRWRLEMPLAPDQPLSARYYRPEETRDCAFAPLLVTVDPATLAVTSRRFWGGTVMTWIYDLHYTLLLDRSGRQALGVLALLWLLGLVSGVVLWWPAKGRRLAALKPKWRAGAPRRVYDLHVLGGIYGLPVLLVVAVSGLLLEVPDWFAPAIAKVSPPTPWYQPEPLPAGAAVIGPDAAVAIARRSFPQAVLRWVETPAADYGAYRVNFHQPAEPSRRFPRTNVWIDARSGAVLAIRDPAANSAGDSLLDWLHPLHNGEAFGLAGRLLVLLIGLLPPLLLVSGLWRWRQKNRARRVAEVLQQGRSLRG